MKKSFIFAILALTLTACGYTQRDAELIGQVKKIATNTPLICGTYKSADISLGVMRGGVGSMSTQDVWVVINNDQEKILKDAVESGRIVKVKYDVLRLAFCTEDHVATGVEYTK